MTYQEDGADIVRANWAACNAYRVEQDVLPSLKIEVFTVPSDKNLTQVTKDVELISEIVGTTP